MRHRWSTLRTGDEGGSVQCETFAFFGLGSGRAVPWWWKWLLELVERGVGGLVRSRMANCCSEGGDGHAGTRDER